MAYFAITFIFYLRNRIKKESYINKSNLLSINKLPFIIKHNADYFRIFKWDFLAFLSTGNN